MSIWFYKRKKIGGVNFNFSKNGIGTSIRLFKGLNIGVNAKGKTYISGGLFGFRYRNYLDDLEEEQTQEQVDSKKFFLNQIPNKYKSTFWHKLALFLFWFFAMMFFTALIGLFIPNIEKPDFLDYFIFTIIIVFSAYKLFFSDRAKQRRLMQQVIFSVVNDDAQNAIINIDNIMKLEKNPANNERLFNIKNALIKASST